VQAAVALARRYHHEGRSYRIINPYDAHRALVEKELKDADLPYEDVSFCVDSFQGNEADHIIVCLVRTEKVGFTRDLRRSSIMLSRCRQSMVVLTSKRFVGGVGRDTLAGKMAAKGGQAIWVSWTDFLSEQW
jgi:superfamily I DNA and/or RNA helicase